MEKDGRRERWTVIKWAWVDCFRERARERQREVMKEKEGLCHLLCAEGRGEGEQTSLAKESGGDGDEEAGREVYIWRETERKRDKKHEGGSEVERDLVPVWQPCFFYTSSVGSPLHGNPFDLRQCVTDREDWVCVQIDGMCVCVCVCPDHMQTRVRVSMR